MNLIKTINFNQIGDDRGYLVSLESQKNIPFDIKRIYYLFGMNTAPRGFHAHKDLEQVAVCISGTCTILIDDGNNKQSIKLEEPTLGLVISPMQWHEMHDFSKDCVLMVLASEHYDESDYIRSYDDFLKAVKNDT